MSVTHLKLVSSEPEAPAGEGPALRVAIATRDMKSMNAHFGSADRFAIYDVTAEGWSFCERCRLRRRVGRIRQAQDRG